MSRLILILVLLILIVHDSFQRQVTVQEVNLQCQREVTSKIVCTLPSDAGEHNILEITSSFSYIRRDMTDMEVCDATEVSLNDKHMPMYMPFGIGEQFSNLEALWLVKSKMKIIKKDNFVKMQQLKALNLYENQIMEIPADTFQNLPYLEYLDIDNNQIAQLHPDLLINQPDLLIFRGSFNHISAIPDGFFRSNNKIEQIVLNNNKITAVMVDFTKFSELLIVDFEGNSNGCDFSVGYFDYDYYDKNDSTTVNTISQMAWLQYKIEKLCRN